MNEHEHGETFRYSYSAGEQAEIQRIRQKYIPAESASEDKMERLRRLDDSVTRKGATVSLLLGVLGCLILGTGMSMIMVWGNVLFLPGVLVGIVGLVMTLIAYPAYDRVTKKERKRIAPEILRLTDELMQ